MKEVDLSNAFTVTKQFSRYLSAGASLVMLKTGKQINYYGYVGAREEYAGITMAQTLDRHRNLR